MGINGEEFLYALDRSNAVLAGSFPLQCLLGERYDGSDIDVFVYEHPKRDAWGHSESEIQRYVYRNADNKSPEEYIIRGVIGSKKYKIKDAIVNIVRVSEEDLGRFVMNTFDLSICQTVFKKQRLFFHKETLDKRGYVVNPWTKAKDRQSYHVSTKSENNNYYPQDIDKYMREKLSERIAKYTQRGFKISKYKLE